MGEGFWIGGKHAVKEAVLNPQRTIIKVYLNENLKEEFNSLKKITKKNFSIEIKNNKQIDQIFKNNSFKHQGIASLIEKISETNIKDKLLEIKQKNNSIIVILDNITDQRNIGSIIRSSVAFNVDILIILKKNYNHKDHGLYKSASGCMEHITLIPVSNIAQTIELLKQFNYWVLGLDQAARQSFASIDISKKIAFVLGSEDRGIRDLVKKKCDDLIKIEINKSSNSLNVSNACSACLAITNYKLNENNNFK
jgi:23S rRNA (guanosine2251-2'-O)-methyltransferase